MRTWTVLVVSTLPALSVLENVSVWSPSVVTGTLGPLCVGPPSSDQLVEATPERSSEGDNVTVTFVLFHTGSAEAVVTGAVRSIFTAGLLVEVLEFAARSLTDALAVRPVPSPEIVLLAGQVPGTIPESASPQVHWMIT